MSDRFRDERGAALITVMLALLMLSAVALTTMRMATMQTRTTGVSRDYEAAVHAAESGADEVILRMFSDPLYTTGQVYNPASPGGPAEERAWAVAQFNAALGTAANFVTVDGATGIGFRPTNGGVPMDRIYAVGRVSTPIADRIRVLRLTIATGTYIPEHALLTATDLTLRGATGARIQGAAGHAHANGNIAMSGNPTVSGNVTSTGTVGSSSNVSGTIAGGQATVPIPRISARSLYPLKVDYSSYSGSTYTGTWYDMCADGTVRPPATGSGAPCSNPSTVGNGSGSGFRGWTFKTVPITEWTFSTTGLWSGAYYVYNSKVDMLAAPPGTAITVFAEGPTGVSSQAGSINVVGAPVMTPFVQGISLLADRDIRFLGTGATGLDLQGLVAAGEQVDIGGNAAITGAVIAGQQSTLSNLVTSNDFGGSGFINYAGGLATALPGVVRITHWNEL